MTEAVAAPRHLGVGAHGGLASHLLNHFHTSAGRAVWMRVSLVLPFHAKPDKAADGIGSFPRQAPTQPAGGWSPPCPSHPWRPQGHQSSRRCCCSRSAGGRSKGMSALRPDEPHRSRKCRGAGRSRRPRFLGPSPREPAQGCRPQSPGKPPRLRRSRPCRRRGARMRGTRAHQPTGQKHPCAPGWARETHRQGLQR